MKVWHSLATVALVLALTVAVQAGGPKGGHGHKGHGGNHGHHGNHGNHGHNGHHGHQHGHGHKGHVHHGHGHHGHGHHGHVHQHYHKQYGHAFKHGYYYKGYSHKHWKHCYWDARYSCYLYYDPYAVGYYYWCAPDNCYYPVGYSPYKKFVFTPSIQGQLPAAPEGVPLVKAPQSIAPSPADLPPGQ